MQTKSLIRLLILVLFVSLVASYFWFDLGRFLTLDYIQSQQAAFADYYQAHPIKTVAAFMFIYIMVTAASIPGAALLTLLAGGLLGLWVGLVAVSFASTIGATLAFLAARFLFQDAVQQKFRKRLQGVNDGIRKEGAFYLFALRMIPVVPFFLINLLMALTPIKTWTFFWVSQLGMLLGTFAYVNAGTQLAKIDALSGILSPIFLGSLALIGLVPIVSKWLVGDFRARKLYSPYNRPKQFDYNLIVIGAGAAGLVTAYIASAVKAKVALVEKHQMGGDCLNTGCVPSKALIRTGQFLSEAKNAKKLGIREAKVEFDFAEVMDRVQSIIKAIEPHDSAERYQSLGVDCYEEEAEIISPFEVRVGEKIYSTKNIVIATGARPWVPPIKGIEDISYFTSDTIWTLETQPKQLCILGGGPIGCELAQTFARLGTEVTLVEPMTHLLPREDAEVGLHMVSQLNRDGVKVLTKTQATGFVKTTEGFTAELLSGEETFTVNFDTLLVAVGRKANVTGFGLESLGVEIRENGTVEADAFLRTNFQNIYVCGDVTGPYQFTHTAAHQAWYTAVNALFSPLKSFKVDYSVIPAATYTEPQVARVGLNEQEAKADKIPYEVTRFSLNDFDRALVDSANDGLVKVLTVPGKDEILGVTIIAKHAGEMIAEYVLAMKHGLGLKKILGTIHTYPTWMEANKFVAGEWQRRNKPEKLLTWVEKFHAWRRG